MSSKLNFIKENYWIAFYILSLIIIFLNYQYQHNYPPVYDAGQYINIANHYMTNGLFAQNPAGHMRLYAFPYILSFFFGVFGSEHAVAFYSIFVSLGYIILSIMITKQFKEYININIIHLAFAMNIFLFPYLVITLSDGLSVLSLMLIFFLLLKIISTEKYSYILIFLYCRYLNNDPTC